MYGWGPANGWMWIGNLLTLAWFLVIMLAIFLVVRHLLKHGFKDEGHNVDTPLDILKKRYASGDIDKKEFDDKRKDIER